MQVEVTHLFSTTKDSLPENFPTIHALIDNLLAAPLIKGAGGIKDKIYLQFNYNHLLTYYRLIKSF